MIDPGSAEPSHLSGMERWTTAEAAVASVKSGDRIFLHARAGSRSSVERLGSPIWRAVLRGYYYRKGLA